MAVMQIDAKDHNGNVLVMSKVGYQHNQGRLDVTCGMCKHLHVHLQNDADVVDSLPDITSLRLHLCMTQVDS